MTWAAPTAWGAILPGAASTRPTLQGERRRGSPGFAQQPLLPGIGAAHDAVEIIVARMPTELGADAIGAGHQHRGIPGATRRLAHLEWFAGDALDACEHLSHAVAVSVADVESDGCAARAQVGERVHVCGR